jgi:hypothetical protein
VTEDAKRAAIREFFLAPRPFLHPRTLVVGGCVAFLGVLSALTGDGTAGVAVAAIGALYAVALPVRRRPRPGDWPEEAELVSLLRYPAARERYRARLPADRVMAWLLEDIGRIEGGSSARLGLVDTTRDPICVVGPLYTEDVRGLDPELVLRRRVADGFLYSSYRISVFQFTDAHLGVYQCNYNVLEDHVAAEETAELFYKDVVAVRMTTESPRQVLKSGERLERSTTFSLTLSSGDRIRIVVDDPAIGAGEHIRSLGDAAAANVRAMLRQYKAPLQSA